MKDVRAVVRTIMCGAGTHQRFTQDSPILPDVWAQYLEHASEPRYRAKLLIEPWSEVPPFEVAKRMRLAMGEEKFRTSRTVYNRTILASELTVTELLTDIIPMTGWYTGIAKRQTSMRRGKAHDSALRDVPRAPQPEEMWEDIVRPEKPSYPYPEFLSFFRIAGLIGYLRLQRGDDKTVEERVEEIGSVDAQTAQEARMQLVRYIRDGLLQGLQIDTLPKPGAEATIFAVYCNRKATLAIARSVKTVKGDAAKRLFSIECKDITWAVIDCGIDAAHPAFLDRSENDQDRKDDAQRLRDSRVTETYDFTYLHSLLLGEKEKLPKHYLEGEGTEDKERFKEIERRIQRSRNVDWELLRPYLKVPHEAGKYKVPTDSHGTHVAGILAANWPRDGAPIHGMCGDIWLLDFRVCHEDGTSDEFIIISALQFLRHLNANAESSFVFGVNMSLSLPHDVTVSGCGQTQICKEADRTVASGVVVVAAAGNLGHRRLLDENSKPTGQYCPISITDPGNAESVITVGSTHRTSPHAYGISFFSSRGPTGDGRVKPDLVAPGEKIVAPALDQKTLPLDGTSMAAPHVSGAAALLMARHGELRGQPDRIKEILCSTATDLGRERYFQGHGLVDVLRAIQSV